MIGELLRAWNERRKLAKGRCANCDAVLRDDQRDWCSDTCATDYQNQMAY